MKEARYFYVPDAAKQAELPQDEAVHALRVLRLKEGDELFLMDGAGSFFRAAVTLTNSKHCFYEVLEALPQEKTWRGRIHLAIAPTKNIDRIEWLAEKATEVGFDEISFLDCQFSERRQLREDRIEKIVVAAMKQSRKAWLPKVNAMIPFRKFVEMPREGRKFIAHCYEEIERKDFFEEIRNSDFYAEIGRRNPSENLPKACISPDSSVLSSSQPDLTILVGPEGDFSTSEVQLALENGYKSVSLGASRLRTETAGLSAVMMANLVMRNES